MIIQINDQYRIQSDENTWNVQKKNKSEKSPWLSLAYCGSCPNAVTWLFDHRVRKIDSSDPKEIIREMGKIRDEIHEAWKQLFEVSLVS